MSVRQWAIAGFAAATILILGLAGFAWNFAQQTLAASNFVSHTHQVVAQLATAQATLERAESSQRAFMIAGRLDHLAERDQALLRFDQAIQDVGRSTADNPVQQDHLADLRQAMRARVEVYRETERLLLRDERSEASQRLSEGTRLMARIRPILEQMTAVENGLLEARSTNERERAVLTGAMFSTLIVALLLAMPLIGWRVRRDMLARQTAERLVAQAQRHEALHAEALTLYNNQPTRGAVMDGTLAILARSPVFLCTAFYTHEEMGGMLRLAASHAAPADMTPLVRVGDGPIGLAAKEMRTVEIDQLGDGGGFRIDSGLARLAPAAVLFVPVVFQGHLCGVLGVAASSKLDDGDRAFLGRLCAQWGVAMHNLAQVAELGQLAEQLRIRGEDIQLKNAELKKADRMKSEFLANMSHELRTPLNAVIGFSEILKDGMVGDLTSEQTEYVTDIFTSGKHLLSLINDILDLSKVESGHSPLELELLEPHQLASSGMSVMREKAGTQHVRLRSVCDTGLGELLIDARKAKQIVYNLLANAVKFTPEGGHVTLTMARTAADAVRTATEQRYARVFDPIELDLHAEFLTISVADTGIGIAPADLERLFQPFVQIDSSLSRKYAGTGLGLMMVKRLAELHGGGVMVTSEPEQGSTFTVWLPWREPSADDVAQALPDLTGKPVLAPTLPSSEAPLVLVVEDDARAASLVVSHLEGQGYRVELSRTAEEGLKLAAELLPSVIVLDIILPGIDGWDMLSRMKELEATRNIPVVIVSITDESRRGFALGASQVLTKPVIAEDLLAAVASVELNSVAGGTVLVVDDDPMAVTLVSKHLEVAGFTPVAAYGGAEALDLARRQPPSLIILDLMMPAMSGFDVVRALRDDPLTADVPVIVLTAKLLTADDRLTLSGQVQQVLEKSEFVPASLLAEVRRALAKRRLPPGDD